MKLFVDNHGIMRLQGRFGSTNFETNVKYPILIFGKNSYFTKLFVRHCHENNLHTGIEATLNFPRRKFWIVKGRQTVKSILHKCIIL